MRVLAISQFVIITVVIVCCIGLFCSLSRNNHCGLVWEGEGGSERTMCTRYPVLQPPPYTHADSTYFIANNLPLDSTLSTLYR